VERARIAAPCARFACTAHTFFLGCHALARWFGWVGAFYFLLRVVNGWCRRDGRTTADLVCCSCMSPVYNPYKKNREHTLPIARACTLSLASQPFHPENSQLLLSSRTTELPRGVFVRFNTIYKTPVLKRQGRVLLFARTCLLSSGGGSCLSEALRSSSRDDYGGRLLPLPHAERISTLLYIERQRG